MHLQHVSRLLWPLPLTLRSDTLWREIMSNMLSRTKLLQWLLARKKVLTPLSIVACAESPCFACYIHSVTGFFFQQQQSHMNSLSQKGHVGFNNNGAIHKASIIWNNQHVQTMIQSFYVCFWEVVWIYSLKACEFTVSLALFLFLAIKQLLSKKRSDPKIKDSCMAAVYSVREIEMVFFWGNCWVTFWIPKRKVSFLARRVGFLVEVA